MLAKPFYVHENQFTQILNLSSPVTVVSNFQAIEPLGTARRLSKEDKDYTGVARPTLIGYNNKSTVKEWN